MIEETLLAFDFGEKRLGVAVGNNLTRTARPLTVAAVSNDATRFAFIAALLEEWRPARLVVGIPRRADGQEHLMTRRAERFANQLAGRFALPVCRVDERYTSLEAAARHRAARAAGARRRSGAARGLDDVAASVILESYFEGTHADLSHS